MNMITTIYGEIEESKLVKTVGSLDNEFEYTTWVEYRQPGSDEIVHRSVHVTLKDPLISTGALGE